MLTANTVKNKIGVDVALSSEMTSSLELWSLMYKNQATWLNENVKSLNLPASISGELSRMTTIELKVTISGDSERAKYLQSQVDKMVPKLRQMIEYGNAKGGLMMKPFPNGSNIDVDYVQAEQFLPISFDTNGNIASCVFVDQRTVGRDYYTRLEGHSFDSNSGIVTIKNLAYKSTSPGDIGQQIDLTSFEPWANLLPVAQMKNIKQPLYGYYRFPMANNVDTTSPLGVSCFSRAQTYDNAVTLIKDADELYSNLVWEFESGKRAIYVDELAFSKDKTTGKSNIPDKRLYRTLTAPTRTIGESGKLFDEWSPDFRNEAFQSGLDAMLKKIEYQCGLAYGTISDPAVEAKTATEIKISKQRTYATVTDTQKSLQTALEQLIYAMDVWATLNKLSPVGSYTTIYDFDDSVIVDKDVQILQDRQAVSAGELSKWRFLIRNYGLDEETAKAWVQEAQDEVVPVDNPFQGA